ncbi:MULTISPECIES: hypothetical protein [unclassified Campylobacter]|uniref:hypothetical protein n=1 Tax=unclassified Campylobacter TaxID=2593542 RepID=UPI001475ADE8|nr:MULTISPECIES: hypothetical protein [unclassified Campylobacter]
MEYDWKEISLATKAQILLKYMDLDFSRDGYQLVNIYDKKNKVSPDWFYDEENKILAKSAEKTKQGKYNFSFTSEKNQQIEGIIQKVDKIILGCIDVQEDIIYRIEIDDLSKILQELETSKRNGKAYTLTIDNPKTEKDKKILEINIKEKYFESWKILSRAEKMTTNKRVAEFGGMSIFYNWYKKIGNEDASCMSKKKCCYCGVKEIDLEKYFNENNSQYKESKRHRGKKLEVERIVSVGDKNKYSDTNCGLACYICNNAKSDFISAKDFLPIAKGINQFWNDYFKNNNINTKAEFDENSGIWENF